MVTYSKIINSLCMKTPNYSLRLNFKSAHELKFCVTRIFETVIYTSKLLGSKNYKVNKVKS